MTEVKVGDQFVLVSHGEPYGLAKVTKIAKKYFVLSNESKWRQVGSYYRSVPTREWDNAGIEPVTPEWLETLRFRKIYYKAMRVVNELNQQCNSIKHLDEKTLVAVTEACDNALIKIKEFKDGLLPR
jgi:hypothetical protein